MGVNGARWGGTSRTPPVSGLKSALYRRVRRAGNSACDGRRHIGVALVAPGRSSVFALRVAQASAEFIEIEHDGVAEEGGTFGVIEQILPGLFVQQHGQTFTVGVDKGDDLVV